MPELKLHRHEKFARAYVKLNNAAAAYREVYGPKGHTARANGWDLLNNRGNIKARVKELRHQMAKRADITEDKILSDYEWAIQSAKAQDKPNEVTMAATAQAKLVGLLRDRVETGEVGDFENMNTLSEVLEAVSGLVSPEAALELAKAFGIAQAAKPTSDVPIEDTMASDDRLSIAKPASDSVN
jgi:hypothetical protein